MWIAIVILVVVIAVVLHWRNKKGTITRSVESPVRQVLISDLAKKDPRWSKLEQLFKQTQTKPDIPHGYTEEEIKEYQMTSLLPKDLKAVDADERKNKGEAPTGDSTSWMWKRGKWTRPTQQTGGIYSEIARLLSDLLKSKVTIRGVFYYPPGGYRVWHSNRIDPPGLRFYIIGGNGGAFHYLDNGAVKTVKDVNGSINIFRVSQTDPFYHSVTSEGDRWSLGFLVENEDIDI